MPATGACAPVRTAARPDADENRMTVCGVIAGTISWPSVWALGGSDSRLYWMFCP